MMAGAVSNSSVMTYPPGVSRVVTRAVSALATLKFALFGAMRVLEKSGGKSTLIWTVFLFRCKMSMGVSVNPRSASAGCCCATSHDAKHAAAAQRIGKAFEPFRMRITVSPCSTLQRYPQAWELSNARQAQSVGQRQPDELEALRVE